MARLDYSTQRLTAKIVYYGPGLCGKTTNLRSIHAKLPDDVRGKMLAFATKEDRTLIFDFLPVDLGDVRGMDTRVQLYTVPGQVFYNETRKLVLKGVDGIVFVADSQRQLMGANVESLQNLEENLKAQGTCLAEIPHVIQYNKQDLPLLSSVEEMNAALNAYNSPFYTSVATVGTGVLESLRGIVKLVLVDLTEKFDRPLSARAEAPAISLL
jgi:signal recognition particle receptor subunit beta